MTANDMQLLGYETKTTYDDLRIRWLGVRGFWFAIFGLLFTDYVCLFLNTVLLLGEQLT